MRILIAVLLTSASLCSASEPPVERQSGPAAAAEPAAPAADAAPSRTAARSDEAAPPESADQRSAREKAEDESLVKEGYKIKVVDGEKRYCKKDTVLGSRLNRRTICWTAEQIRANKEDADILRDRQNQRRTDGG
jgi:hypothetical protein